MKVQLKNINGGQRIGLHDVDLTSYPNLALMKLCAWHRKQGDKVEWYWRHRQYDLVYSSKVFTFSNRPIGGDNVIRGGSGYSSEETLPDTIEHICPDYEYFGLKQSYGFITRGCPNHCPWCVVPSKEGPIRPNAPLEEFVRHNEVILMDNNILAHEFGIQQLERLATRRVRIDLNQGVDAARIDIPVAKLFAKLMWLEPVRLACDHISRLEVVVKAIQLMRWYNVEPRRYSVYMLLKSDQIENTLEILKVLKGMDVTPYLTPYRSLNAETVVTEEQKQLARWVNHRAIFKCIPWEEYRAGASRELFRRRRRRKHVSQESN